MSNIAQNIDLSSYIAIKHSWRGKYSRLFTIGTKNLTTYNSQKLELTNQWNWREVVGAGVDNTSGVASDTPNAGTPNGATSPSSPEHKASEFFVTTRKANGKPETTKYSTDFRSDLQRVKNVIWQVGFNSSCYSF